MGFIFLASNLGMLPSEFWNFWPLILIVVGLGGLLTSDRAEWIVDTKKPKAKSKSKAKRTKKPARKKKK